MAVLAKQQQLQQLRENLDEFIHTELADASREVTVAFRQLSQALEQQREAIRAIGRIQNEIREMELDVALGVRNAQ